MADDYLRGSGYCCNAATRCGRSRTAPTPGLRAWPRPEPRSPWRPAGLRSGQRAALDGVTGAYFCNPIAPGLLEATALFAQAAVDATSHAAQHHWIAERLLDRTPMLTTHLRPTFFAEWLDWYWATDGTSGVTTAHGRRAARPHRR